VVFCLGSIIQDMLACAAEASAAGTPCSFQSSESAPFSQTARTGHYTQADGSNLADSTAGFSKTPELGPHFRSFGAPGYRNYLIVVYGAWFNVLPNTMRENAHGETDPR